MAINPGTAYAVDIMHSRSAEAMACTRIVHDELCLRVQGLTMIQRFSLDHHVIYECRNHAND